MGEVFLIKVVQQTKKLLCDLQYPLGDPCSVSCPKYESASRIALSPSVFEKHEYLYKKTRFWARMKYYVKTKKPRKFNLVWKNRGVFPEYTYQYVGIQLLNFVVLKWLQMAIKG